MLNFYQGPIRFSNYLFAAIDVLARRRHMSIFVVFFLSFGGSWLWSLSQGIPIPYAQDEYSYLLAGDTFAHGRVTNPAHPMWIHFESFQVLQHPSYMSKYLPGQGIFLAAGQVLFGHPIYGVWLSAGLMCAAICWMLYAWVSPRWALIGGLVAALQFGIFTSWSQSYWGGAVPAIGGALVLGALPRIFKNQCIRDALWLGLGCAILAISRPLEGFLVAVPVGCLVLPWKRFSTVIPAKAGIHNKFIKKIILPLSIILFITALGMGAYNKQITGNAAIFPYLLYTHTYREVPLFIWQPLTQVKFNHKMMELFEKNYTEKIYIDKKTWKGFFKAMQNDVFVMSMFFFGFPLAIPSLAVGLLLFFHRRKAARYWMALLILLVTCAIMTCIARTRYFSPLTCLAVLLIITGLRGLAGLKLRSVRLGLVFVMLLIFLQLFLNIILTRPLPATWSLARKTQSSSVDGSNPFFTSLPASFTREQLKDILIKQGGKYLVIVRYPLWHIYHFEWVYNDSDIDHAPIVWARDMDEEHNKELLEYFKDRQALLINVYWDSHEGTIRFDER